MSAAPFPDLPTGLLLGRCPGNSGHRAGGSGCYFALTDQPAKATLFAMHIMRSHSSPYGCFAPSDSRVEMGPRLPRSPQGGLKGSSATLDTDGSVSVNATAQTEAINSPASQSSDENRIVDNDWPFRAKADRVALLTPESEHVTDRNGSIVSYRLQICATIVLGWCGREESERSGQACYAGRRSASKTEMKLQAGSTRRPRLRSASSQAAGRLPDGTRPDST